MRKLVIAFCDTDRLYGSRFVTYLMEHKAKEMSVHAFLEPDVFLRETEKTVFDAVVLGGGFDAVEEVLLQKRLPTLRLLEEAPAQTAGETAGQSAVLVWKYQPMSVILHEMQALTESVSGAAGTGAVYEPGLEVIGVYSPIRHEMQVPFSLMLASVLAKRSRVLYLNLTEQSGFPEAFHLSGENDIGDLLFALRKGRIKEAFQKSVYENSGIGYIPPFFNPEQLGELTPGDLRELLSFAGGQSNFEAVVADFGDGVHPLSEMLGMCSTVYAPVKEGYFYECQKESFLSYLTKAGAEELRNAVQFLDLPFSARGIRFGGDVLEQLAWSEFGDYVRTYLEGARYGGGQMG